MTLSPAVPLPPLTRIAIVGAGGPSGLVALRQLLVAGVPANKISAYEGRDRAGGVWNYESEPGTMHVEWRESGPPVVRAQNEVENPGANGPSAMYDKLRTNLPNKIMNYRNTPFPKDTPIFPTHAQIATYLQEYAQDDNLSSHISFNTRVTGVYHTSGTTDPAEKWTVETEHRKQDGTTIQSSEKVSHVVISNGHYNEPFLPPIPGLDGWKGQLLHSRWWRNPVSQRGKNVVVVGSRASGSDIARELAIDDEDHPANPKRTIYHSVRGLKPGDTVWDDDFAWAKRINVVHEILSVGDDGTSLHLEDGTTLSDVDTLVFATGYLYSYPFFPDNKAPWDKYPVTTALATASNGLPRAGGQDIRNLNTSDTFYEPDPTLAFIGLHYAVNPFPLGEASARLIAFSYTHDRIPPLPPLRRATDKPNDKTVGCPAEFDNQDAWLLAIGEGGVDGGGKPGGWPQSTEETREMRANALKMRKKVLGY